MSSRGGSRSELQCSLLPSFEMVRLLLPVAAGDRHLMRYATITGVPRPLNDDLLQQEIGDVQVVCWIGARPGDL